MREAHPKILLVGATGLVGRSVVQEAGDLSLTILARRDPGDLPDRHLLLVAPPERWADMIAAQQPEVLVSCLGTTIRTAGSQAAFRAVDRDLILSAARGARVGGAARMIVVSSVGASARSRNFYLRTKGETEEGLRALGFDRLDMIRPGLLTGKRPGPARLGEGIAIAAAPLFDALLFGSLRRYRSIPAEIVAKAILTLASRRESGSYVQENDAIRALAD